jgi:hypothetical protein
MSLVVPSLRGIVASPPWAKNELWRKALAVPTLDLRFADSKSLTDAVSGQNLIDFTRSGDGTYVDSDRLIKVALANEPRFDHDPETGESLGLLIEEQRTNSIRNNTMAGAVVGTPGTLPTNWTQTVLGSGLTSQVVSVGTQGGINYVDVRVSGTAGDALGWAVAFDGSTQIVASSGQSWSGSVYVAIIGGSLAGTTSQFLRIIERNGAGSYVTESNVTWNTIGSSFGPSSRLSVTRPSMGEATGYVQAGMYFQTAIGAAIDITLRIGLPQLEQGAFATSVIPTTSAEVTRNADVASITGANFSSWYSQSEGTVFTSQKTYAAESTPGAYWFQKAGVVGRGITAVFDTRNTAQRLSCYVRDDVLQGTVSVAGLVDDTIQNVAHAWSGGTTSAALNGTLNTGSYNAVYPGIDTLNLGYTQISAGSPAWVNGTISRLTFFDSRLPDATLQAITSP